MTDRPAILGGDPAFDPPLPFSRPTSEHPSRTAAQLEEVLRSGRLTDGPRVRLLEERVAERFETAECVAVSSCTVGLMLLIQALAPDPPAVIPSFTFSATAHAAAWNHLPITFADCDPATWCLGPDDIDGPAGVVVGVHVSGVPCDVDRLALRAGELGADLVFDAAHGAGSLVSSGGRTRPLGGFGRAEVFSLTPTKVLSGAEGGLITTNDRALAEHLRTARNYGNPGDYDTRFPGLNARLSELHAVLALEALESLEDRVIHRNELAQRYRRALSGLRGLVFQEVPVGARSSFKDFTVLVDREDFGCSSREVVASLEADGIATRRYYAPPVHRQVAYADQADRSLPVTERLGAQVVSLPIWSHMPLDVPERIGDAFARIHRHADEVAALKSWE